MWRCYNGKYTFMYTHYVHVEKKAEANTLLSRVGHTAIKWRYKRADIPRVGSDAKLPWRWRSGWWTVGGGDLWRSKRERDNTLKAGRVYSSRSQHLWVQRCHSVSPGRWILNTNRCLWLVEGQVGYHWRNAHECCDHRFALPLKFSGWPMKVVGMDIFVRYSSYEV